MYEENATPLSHHDGNVVFAEQLDTLRLAGLATPAPAVTPETVVRWADRSRLPAVASICRRLLLPGSCLCDVEHLQSLVALAQQGKSSLLCLNHRSTLDVPTLYTLLEDQSDPAVFDRIIWISGRKLEEDVGMTMPWCSASTESWSHLTAGSKPNGTTRNCGRRGWSTSRPNVRSLACVIRDGYSPCFLPGRERDWMILRHAKRSNRYTDTWIYSTTCCWPTSTVAPCRSVVIMTSRTNRLNLTRWCSGLDRSVAPKTGSARRLPVTRISIRDPPARAITDEIERLQAGQSED